MKKKIGFDGKRALNNLTGLGNYSRFVIEALLETYPQHEYIVYTPKVASRFEAFCRQLSQKAKIVKPFWRVHRRLHALWRTWLISTTLKKQELDIYHGLSNELPLGLKKANCRKIVTVHDLIFLRYPKLYSRVDRGIYLWKFRYACRTADHIIAVSEVTKNDIIRFFGIDKAKISVVSMSCDSIFYQPLAPDSVAKVRLKYHLPDTFILCVGTIEERKNQLLLLKAMAKLRETAAAKVVFVGKKTLYYMELQSMVAELSLGDRVQFISQVEWEDLPAIYHASHIFAYPSVFEGFGIPVLEAMTCGVPVVTTKGTSMEGIGQQACLYFDNNNADDLARQIRTLIDDEPLRRQLIRAGKQRAAQFDKSVIAGQLMQVYEA